MARRHYECTGCNKQFSRSTSFFLHRIGTYQPMTRRCMTEQEMRKHGLYERGGVWYMEVAHVPAHWREVAADEESEPKQQTRVSAWGNLG